MRTSSEALSREERGTPRSRSTLRWRWFLLPPPPPKSDGTAAAAAAVAGMNTHDDITPAATSEVAEERE